MIRYTLTALLTFVVLPVILMGLMLLGVFALVGAGVDWEFMALCMALTAAVGVMTALAEISEPR